VRMGNGELIDGPFVKRPAAEKAAEYFQAHYREVPIISFESCEVLDFKKPAEEDEIPMPPSE
jgi:hypothetical protein